MRRRGDGRGRVAVRLLHPGRDVAGHVVVDQVLGGARRVEADDRRQEVVVDHDPGHGVLGEVAVVGHDEGDRLADVVDLVLGQGVLRAPLGQGGVRDEQRQRLGHGALEVVVGPDGVDAFAVEDRVDVDRDDARMGVRAAEHRRVQGVAAHVVDIAPLATDEAVVLHALDRGADHPRRHGVTSSAASSAARWTDRRMFW